MCATTCCKSITSLLWAVHHSLLLSSGTTASEPVTNWTERLARCWRVTVHTVYVVYAVYCICIQYGKSKAHSIDSVTLYYTVSQIVHLTCTNTQCIIEYYFQYSFFSYFLYLRLYFLHIILLTHKLCLILLP